MQRPRDRRWTRSALPVSAVLCILIFVSACTRQEPPHSSDQLEAAAAPAIWTLVYANDQEGAALEGSKEALIEAVRAGKPVRVYVRGRRVEHSAEAQFLTVFEDEVFAQITEIHSQQPSVDPTRVSFREPGQYWRAIYGTTGAVEALMDGNEPRQNLAAVRWYVPTP